MVNEAVLEEALVTMAEYCKQQFIVVSSVMSELAAVRETVRGLDPTFDEVLKVKREDTEDLKLLKGTLPLIDELIRRLRADLIPKT